MIHEFRKREIIHGANQPATSLYLIIDGAVRVSRLRENGGEVLMDIYQPDEFFGESAFIGPSQNWTELSVAVEDTKVMAWNIDQIERIVLDRHPQLAIGLLQLFSQRSADFGVRIESFSVDNIDRRLARALLRFSRRLGRNTEDGGVQMMPFTHGVLAQYIGTSREIVTQYMNQFRRQGYLSYSRKGILLHRTKIEDWLAAPGVLISTGSHRS
jgi:CRP/FNR family transcriptional regulator, cyclic AMP receptor protein